MTLSAAHLLARRVGGERLSLSLGEGPVWDGPRDRVLWVDILAGAVFAGPFTGDVLGVDRSWSFDEPVGSVLPALDGGLVVVGERHLHRLDPEGTVTGSIRILPDDLASRLNDAACDPAGRLLVGSLRQDGRVGQETLVSVDADAVVRVLVEGISVSNGIGFSPDGDRLYHVDSVPGRVRAFDYDVSSGTFGGSRVVWQGDGIPDGLNVDVEGNLWIAYFGEGQVRCLSPEGALLAVVDVPVPNVTCPAFIGTDRDRLLIATARIKLSDEQLAAWPDSGEFFVVDVGVAGLPATAWAGSTRADP